MRSPLRDAHLELTGVCVDYGGHRAVSNVSVSAPAGRVTGLIGPNGAGKTTIFDVCSGLLRPSEGEVTFAGHRITRLSPARRARLGLGRTFQRMQLWPSMTVLQNVALGAEALNAGSSPIRQFRATSAHRRRASEAAEEAIEECGLQMIAQRNVGTLSTGQRRLVELGRAYAAGFAMLLLDEPSSGLDHHETGRFGDIVQDMVERLGIGVLLVEHDMGLVMHVCEEIYVLDFGQVIYRGTAGEVQSSEVVQAAYLGGDIEAEAIVSGTMS